MQGEEQRRVRRVIRPLQDNKVAGNRRSDESIREEICASLTRRSHLDASAVEVEVEGGEVTLTGHVEDRDARWLAEEVVESVPGVSLVHNRLRAATS